MRSGAIVARLGIFVGACFGLATAGQGQPVCLPSEPGAVRAATAIAPEALTANRDVVSPPSGRSSGRIVNGEPVALKNHPWQVALVRGVLAEPQRSQFCGGSLIGSNWVLTAAHCVKNSIVREDPARVDVIAGTHLYISGGERLDVAAVLTHPKYNSSTMENDFALLRLSKPVTTGGTAAAQPIGLAGADTRVAAGEKVCVTGWGATAEGGSGSLELLGAALPVVSNETCNEPRSYNGDVTATMMCAGKEEGGTDACQGDSGGPVWAVVQGRQTLVGVVSWGEGCARRLKYGIYARVSAAAEWITSIVAVPAGSNR